MLFLIFAVFSFLKVNAQDFVTYYIDKYKDISISEMNKTGIPASITLAQSMLESNWGRSELSTKANNHFGIKCGNNWTGNTMYWQDDEYKDQQLVESCFRSYDYPEESFYDHSYFITSKSRYQFLFDYDIFDYKSWSKGLLQAGYATDQGYADKLIKIIEKYGLYEYDLKYTPVSKNQILAMKNIVEEKNYTIAYVNGIKIVITKKGDTPISISKSIGILAEDLLKYNDNVKRKYQIFNEGDVVFLEKKSKKYKGIEKTYNAKESETLEDISQKFGVDANYLSKINKTRKTKSLNDGQVIKLKDNEMEDQIESFVSNIKDVGKFLFDEPLSPKN
jgi:LysM repeat protein